MCPKRLGEGPQDVAVELVDDRALVVGVQEADHAPGRHQRRGHVGLQPAGLDHRAGRRVCPRSARSRSRGRAGAPSRSRAAGGRSGSRASSTSRRANLRSKRPVGDRVALPRPPRRVLDAREHRAVEAAAVHDRLAHLAQQLVRLVDPAQRRKPGLERLEPVQPLVHLVVVDLRAEGLQLDERRARAAGSVGPSSSGCTDARRSLTSAVRTSSCATSTLRSAASS